MVLLREALVEAWADTAEMLPLLFLLFLLLEAFQHRLGAGLSVHLERAGRLGPLVGAGLGIIPQCGFSVLASLLYVRGLVTPGTLLAVFLATSDEAVPVMLAQPGKMGYIMPLLIAKLILGIAGGYFTDLLLKRDGRPLGRAPVGGGPVLRRPTPGEHAHRVRAATLVYHAAHQTLHIYAFVVAAATLLNLGVKLLGLSGVSRVLLTGSPLQPVMAAFIGLIPNCAASVVLAQLYLEGALGFGAAVAGLAAAAGLGLLVLARHNPLRDTARLLGLLFALAVAAGLVLPSRPWVL